MRNRTRRFTADEMAIISTAFADGESAASVARRLNSAIASITAHYDRLRHEAPRPKTKALGAARFYKSDFVPS